MPNPIVIEHDPLPRNPIGPVRPENPSILGWPPMLPFELAMRMQPASVICKAYDLSKDEFAELVDDPHFSRAYADAVEGLRKEGMSFKVKARLQAEAMLDKAWTMVHSDETPSNIKADLIKAIVRWAGYEPKGGEVGPGVGNAFQININLGS